MSEGPTAHDVRIKVGDFGLAKIMETSHQQLGFSSINHLIMSAGNSLGLNVMSLIISNNISAIGSSICPSVIR